MTPTHRIAFHARALGRALHTHQRTMRSEELTRHYEQHAARLEKMATQLGVRVDVDRQVELGFSGYCVAPASGGRRRRKTRHRSR